MEGGDVVKFERRLMNVTGVEWCGNTGSPPMTNRSIYVCEEGELFRVFSMIDDGGFVGIGYPDEWHVTMRTESARAFALWTLWIWACDWFGLRSAIYFRALNRSVNGSWRLSYKRRWRWRHNCRISSHEEWRSEQPTNERASHAD